MKNALRLRWCGLVCSNYVDCHAMRNSMATNEISGGKVDINKFVRMSQFLIIYLAR